MGSELWAAREDAARACEPTVAALFVEENGVYANQPGVEVWGISRDARLYAGPHPVVAHPPCERWGRYWWGGPSSPVRFVLGDDGKCFEYALVACRNHGGVLEHPEGSHAWKRFSLNAPPRNGGWVRADMYGGWTCCVEQGHYGHRARKATWLYAFGFGHRAPPELTWGPAPQQLLREAPGRRPTRTGICQNLSRKQRRATPIAFRDALLAIARSVRKDIEWDERQLFMGML